FSSYIIDFIPKYSKWEPAIFSLIFFSLNTVFGSLTTPLTNFLNAIGKVKITLYLMTFWTIITWVFTPIFIKLFGFNGVSFASFLVAVTTLIVLFFVKREVKFSFLTPIAKQFVSAVFMMFFILVSKGIITSLPTLLIDVVFSAAFYIGFLFL